MADKKEEQKQIVPGVSNEMLNGFLKIITFRFIRESREEKEAEKERLRNG